MADVFPPQIQECRTCGALIDTSEEEPLALIHCPTCGAAMRVRRMFDHFEIQEVLGAGGMGAVYRAQDTKLNRSVALKVLRTEHTGKPELIESLTQEAAITASINHPHVVKVFSTGTAGSVFYIAMELVDKGSLDDLMGLQGKVGEIQVLEVGIQVAQGLNAAWQRGLIHRDVKPGNILFADAHTAKITDFGLAVLQEQVAQSTGEIWGTPYYVAPEKLDSPPQEDFRSDIYSLGATLFHALAGRPPFEAETASMVALKHLKSKAVSLQSFAPDVSSATAYVINKALNKDPEERYATYEDFIKSLQYAHEELVLAARNPLKKRRVVVGGENEEAMSWVTFAMVAFIVISGVLAFTFRGRLFPRTKASATPAEAVVPKGPSIDEDYATARQLLADGKYRAAAAAFRALEEKDAATPALQNWIAFHGALAYFLDNQPDEANAELRKVQDRGLYSSDPFEKKMASFFVKSAELAREPTPQTADLAKDYDKSNYECFALLLFAAKDWALGSFEATEPLFRQFIHATPGESFSWIAKYRPIAETHLADCLAWHTAIEVSRSADTVEKQRKALEALRIAQKQLKRPGKLVQNFEDEEARIEKLIQLNEEKQHLAQVDNEAADLKTLAELKSQMKSYCAQYRFVEASRIITSVPMKTEKGRAEQEVWAAYAGGLKQFKATLINDINDINAKGYTQPLPKKNGALPAGRLRASEQQIDVVGFGTVSATWSELAPQGIWALAAYYLRLNPTPDREWQFGLFLLQTGNKGQGLPLLQKAATSRPDLQAILPRLQDALDNP